LPDLGLNELARTAGVSKANVYRYFESREAILLELLWEEAADWWVEYEQLLARRPVGDDLDGFVDQAARSLAARPLLCELMASVPSVLEQNLSAGVIADFKVRILGFFRVVAARMASVCPVLDDEAYTSLLFDTTTTIAGLYHSAHPSPRAAEALRRPELAFFRRDLADELSRFLRALAAAAAADRAQASGPGRPRPSARKSVSEYERSTVSPRARAVAERGVPSIADSSPK
jgi:AcrR family transcriptional regulator